MEELTPEQRLAISKYFDTPDYHPPHGDIAVVQLLCAMIVSGKYEMSEYPRLAEAAIKLTRILAVEFDHEAKRDITRKPEGDAGMAGSDLPYDPIPF
jgi:hypothetical protein